MSTPPKRSSFYSSTYWRKLRRRITIRDQWVCQSCGKDCRQGRWAVDHIQERPQGCDSVTELDQDWNLQLLCWACHNKKTNQSRWAKENTRPHIGADGFPIDSDWTD